MTKKYTDLSKMFKEAREAAGVSQTELARESRISIRTISRMETGDALRRRPRRSVVLRLALALDQDPNLWLEILGYPLVKGNEADMIAQAMAAGESAVRKAVLSTQDLMPILREIANDSQIKSLTMRQLTDVIHLKLRIHAVLKGEHQKPAMD